MHGYGTRNESICSLDVESSMKRRDLLKDLAIGSTVLTTGGLSTIACNSNSKEMAREAELNSLKGNINHSVCRWCFDEIPLEVLCENAVDMGIKSIDLVGVDDWPTLAKYGLTSAMGNGPFMSLTDGFCNPEYHARLLEPYMDLIPKAAESGINNIICFSGNRTDQITDEEGIEHCARGLEPIVKAAEKEGVHVVMELLNSKVDHAGYMCDHTVWGAALVDKIGSPNFKLLYDIYHMQIMEGDVIATIRKFKDYIAHYHTAGVPGRNEIDDTQELYYPAIMNAIKHTGFDGFVAQEFIPKSDDPMRSLQESIIICDI